MDEIIANGKLPRCWLGFGGQKTLWVTVSCDVANLGVIPAEAAGLQVGDIVVSVDRLAANDLRKKPLEFISNTLPAKTMDWRLIVTIKLWA